MLLAEGLVNSEVTVSLEFYRIGEVFWTNFYFEETFLEDTLKRLDKLNSLGNFLEEEPRITRYCHCSMVLNLLKSFVKRQLVTLATNKFITVIDIAPDECLNSKEWWSWKDRLKFRQ